jgi:SpoVK/Ycf46/Vps4 family AAA+-type ATPase
MPRQDRSWRPSSNRPEHIANLRVCLALLRIFRSVELPHEEMDKADVARPFWPLVREHRALLKAALEGCHPRTAKRRPGPPSREDTREQVDAWIRTELVQARSLPLEPPDAIVLEAIGEAMLCDTPSFRPLLDAVEARLIMLVAKRRLPIDDNIQLISELLHLSEIERGFFALAAATVLGSVATTPFSFARWPARLVQAVRVALDTTDEYAVRSMMRRNSRLVRSGLLDVDTFASRHDMEDVLRLSRQALLLLTSGAKSVNDMAAVVLKPLSAAPKPGLNWPHLEDRAKLLARLLVEALRSRATGINLLLYGAPGTGKTQFAKQLVDRVGATGFSVADADVDGDPANRFDRLSSLMLTQVFAPVAASVIVLDEAEDVFQDEYNSPVRRLFGSKEEGKSWMNNLLEGNMNPVVWITNRIDNMDPAYLRRFTYCLEFPQTPRGVRREIAHSHLDARGCSPAVVDSVGTDANVSPAMLASAARLASVAKLCGTEADQGVTLMLTDMVHAMGTKLRSCVPERSTRFDLRYLNVRGAVTPQAVMAGLERSARGRMLLSGSPGTGKTQLAAEVAQRLGRELVYKTASDLNSMWFGQSERNVARMFQDCDAAGEVLFLDEADTLLGVRDASANRPEIAVTAEFLRQVEAFKGVFVCATNFFDAIDPALLRRFEYRLELLPLTPAQRLDLLRETAMAWNGEAAARPQVERDAERRLQKMELLTPGDFANVMRRVTALQLQLDLHGWIDELQAEHDAKPGARHAAVGFL